MNIHQMLARVSDSIPEPWVPEDLQYVRDCYGFSMTYEEAMEELDMIRLQAQSMMARNLVDLVQRSLAIEEGKIAA